MFIVLIASNAYTTQELKREREAERAAKARIKAQIEADRRTRMADMDAERRARAGAQEQQQAASAKVYKIRRRLYDDGNSVMVLCWIQTKFRITTAVRSIDQYRRLVCSGCGAGTTLESYMQANLGRWHSSDISPLHRSTHVTV